MSGRIERVDGRMELFSECSYQHVMEVIHEERIRRWKSRAWKAFLFLVWSGYCWILIDRIARGM